MAPRKPKVTEAQPKQRTDQGTEIPVPKRGEFYTALGLVAKKPSPGKRSPKK